MPGEFESHVSSVALLSDPVRRSLYEYVVGQGRAVGREEAADAAGIARSLAAFHLDKLVDEGLLDVEYRRLTGRTGPGAGRPAKLYRRSAREIEVSIPPREYDVAARLLAAAIETARTEGGDVGTAVVRSATEFGEQLGQIARQRAGARPSQAALRTAVLDVLADHGFEPRADDGEVVLGNCPFHALAVEFTDLVCGMNLALMKGLRSTSGLRGAALTPRLQPSQGNCCVRLAP